MYGVYGRRRKKGDRGGEKGKKKNRGKKTKTCTTANFKLLRQEQTEVLLCGGSGEIEHNAKFVY